MHKKEMLNMPAPYHIHTHKMSCRFRGCTYVETYVWFLSVETKPLSTSVRPARQPFVRKNMHIVLGEEVAEIVYPDLVA